MRFFFLALIAFSSFAVYWFNIRMRPEDIASYEELVTQSLQIRDRRLLKDQTAMQIRQGVEKKIWSQNETCYIQIESDLSTLTLSQEDNHLHIEETLQNLRAQLPNHSFLSAERGFYTFPAHEFTAQNHCCFVQENKEIKAEQMHFDLFRETLTCLSPQGRLAKDSHFEANRLIWNKKQGALIEGFGDVHFSFTLDEQNLIDGLFRQYL